eukprot:4270291-Prymnesium_polylepis.1
MRAPSPPLPVTRPLWRLVPSLRLPWPAAALAPAIGVPATWASHSATPADSAAPATAAAVAPAAPAVHTVGPASAPAVVGVPPVDLASSSTR